MENFKLTVWFHAENLEDAEQQAKQAVQTFDDGFEDAWLASHSGTGRIPIPVEKQ